MTYATRLAQLFGRNQIWLYELTRNGLTTRLTSAGQDYVDGDAVTWTSAVITHTSIPDTSNIERAKVELVMPQSSAIAQGYLEESGYDENTVKIYREFKDQSPQERQQEYLGRVVMGRPALTRIVLFCENNFTETKRKGISQVFQRPCRHVLYHSRNGIGCNLNLADFQIDATLTQVSGNQFTVTEAAEQADGYFAGGVIAHGSPERLQFITAHSGDTLTLLGPLPDAASELASASPAEVAVKIAPGCDLTRATCFARFNNIENHGGYSWADESPYDGRTLF